MLVPDFAIASWKKLKFRKINNNMLANNSEILLLFASAVAGGALNSVTGGGSFVSFPALVLAGIPTISANATNSAVLFPGVIASITAYKKEIFPVNRNLIGLLLVSAIGGVVGGILLIHSSESVFRQIVPILMLGATLLFAFKTKVNTWVRRFTGNQSSKGYMLGVGCLQFLVAIYGGYFGGGLGILLLAVLSLAGLDDKKAIATGRLFSAVINGISLIPLLLSGKIIFQLAALLAVGAVLGGYYGAVLARSLNARVIRKIVISVGSFMSGYFFLSGV